MIRLATSLLVLSCLLQKPATISGNVYYGADGNPAKDVVVNLYNSEHVLLETQATSDSGRFEFGGLRRAVYELSLDVPGFERVTVTVDVSMASDKGLALYLKSDKAKNETPRPPTVSVHELSMPAKAREFMASGKKKLYQRKDPQAALSDFQHALSAAPNYYEAAYELAMAQLTLGAHTDAERSFRKSFELSAHTYADAAVRLGGLLLDRGDIPEGEQTIRAGVQLRPNLWLGHYELGRALLTENRLDESLVSAEQARALAPNVPIVYRLLSNIHLQQRNYPALLSDLDTYLALDPDSIASQRAKEIREQIRQKVAAQSSPATNFAHVN
jgi:tetratricopeptide (TPR) repeat protein